MDRSKLHHRLPFLGRPYRERNAALRERDQARVERDQALKERDQALKERDQALKERFQALKEGEGAFAGKSEHAEREDKRTKLVPDLNTFGMARNSSVLQEYRRNGFPSVEGWCSEQVFDTMLLLDSVPINKSGGFCEIGVHHGKLYMLINCVIESHFQSFAIDVFDQQHLNIDCSGGARLDIFKSNLEKYDRYHGSNTSIIIGDSTDSQLDLVGRLGSGRLRFMSIDGGHTPEHTVNDLVLAEKLISNEGIVILDDIQNYHWLGVIEGAFRFLERKPSLIPVAMGQNKLYLAKISFSNYYREAFAQTPLFTKRVPLLGYNIAAL